MVHSVAATPRRGDPDDEPPFTSSKSSPLIMTSPLGASTPMSPGTKQENRTRSALMSLQTDQFGAQTVTKTTRSRRPFWSIIADGVHVHPMAVNLAYQAHTEGCVLITDGKAHSTHPEPLTDHAAPIFMQRSLSWTQPCLTVIIHGVHRNTRSRRRATRSPLVERIPWPARPSPWTSVCATCPPSARFPSPELFITPLGSQPRSWDQRWSRGKAHSGSAGTQTYACGIGLRARCFPLGKAASRSLATCPPLELVKVECVGYDLLIIRYKLFSIYVQDRMRPPDCSPIIVLTLPTIQAYAPSTESCS